MRYYLLILVLALTAVAGTASVSSPMGMGGGGGTSGETLLVSPVGSFGANVEPGRLVVTPTGRVFITDTANKAIRIYSNNGILLNSIHGPSPQGIASDGNGKVYVGDGSSGQVLVYDEAGNFLSILDSDSETIAYASDIATSTGHVYVVDSKTDEVRVFSLNSSVPTIDTFSDDFDDGVMGSQWLQFNTSYPALEQNGHLEASAPVSSADWKNSGYISSSTIMPGDFDVQIDFSNFARIGTGEANLLLRFITTDGVFIAMVRRINSSENGFVSVIPGTGWTNLISSNVTSGKLRIKRVGTDAYTYFDRGNGWELAHYAGGSSTLGGTLYISAQSRTDTGITVTFDNFRDNLYMPLGNFTFGGEILQAPRGIAVDGSNVYITDDKAKYVRVFGLNGLYSHGIPLGSKVLRPQGIAIDSERLYITDAYNSAVAVFKKNGEFSQYIGNYGSGQGEFKVPLDADFDLNGKLFVADYNNQRVGVIGVGSYINLEITPSDIDFTLENADSLPYHDISIISNVEGTSWTASATEQWMVLSTSNGTAPSTVRLTADAGSLPNGYYNGYIVFKTDNGVESVVKVSLTVDINYELHLTPASIEFKYQIGAPIYRSDPYPTANVMVYSSGGSVHWEAVKSVDWLSISAAGDTPSTVTVAVNQNVEALERGAYSGTITFDAGDITGSPADVTISLSVVEAGTVEVTTNVEEAEFTLTGPDGYEGKGTYWIHDEIEPGDYRIDFKHVPGYQKPLPSRFTIHSGELITIEGVYIPKQVESLVAFSGTKYPDTALITDVNEETQMKIPVFSDRASTQSLVISASGDLDGDGIDEIAFADSTGYLEISRPEGSILISMDMDGIGIDDIGMSDIDRDGRKDLVVGMLDTGEVNFYGFDATNIWIKKGTVLALGKGRDFRLTAGDIDGDGLDEILVSDKDAVFAYDIDENGLASILWNTPNPYQEVSNIASGDLDDDGVDEVIVGAGDKNNNTCTFRILRGNGSYTGVEVHAFADMGFNSGVNVAIGDIDGDFMDEIIVAPGNSSKNMPLIRIFRGDGSLMGLTLDILGYEVGGAAVDAGRYMP